MLIAYMLWKVMSYVFVECEMIRYEISLLQSNPNGIHSLSLEELLNMKWYLKGNMFSGPTATEIEFHFHTLGNKFNWN